MSFNFQSDVRLLRKRYFRYGMKPGILKIQGEQLSFTPASLSTPLYFNLNEVQSYKKYLTILEIKIQNKVYAFEFQPKSTKPEALAMALLNAESEIEKRATKSSIDNWIYIFNQQSIPKHRASKKVWVIGSVWSIFLIYVFVMMYLTRDTSIANTEQTKSTTMSVVEAVLPLIFGSILLGLILLTRAIKKRVRKSRGLK